MTDNALATIEEVLVTGNLSTLKPVERIQYYNKLCESLQLNPLTKPFEYITLNGKLTLYARKDCTDQLRKIRGISIYKMESNTINDVYMVTAYARDASGREDVSMGAVSLGGLKGEALANCFMKAESKAKRRVTLSLGGLGMLDEIEVDTIPSAQRESKDVTPESLEAFADDIRSDSQQGMYKIDGAFVSGLDLNAIVDEKIQDITTNEDLEKYEIWKTFNKDSIQNFCKANKEIALGFAADIKKKRAEI